MMFYRAVSQLDRQKLYECWQETHKYSLDNGGPSVLKRIKVKAIGNNFEVQVLLWLQNPNQSLIYF